VGEGALTTLTHHGGRWWGAGVPDHPLEWSTLGKFHKRSGKVEENSHRPDTRLSF